ncbi:AMP-binding protein [Gordonia neofelifaecis]|uniref:Acyl-CoA synthetase n=1 Tax=Gordonia neofelifaecis NRRL B-59395 TaxID=644548 RepID=F1YMP4_9ACTN|nr:AMP-binding protein [Gordonia neofelifaecis]EGD53979.1 acyl-CoA synthetase [Gordonia neofelifaecis NRRL B-59395]
MSHSIATAANLAAAVDEIRSRQLANWPAEVPRTFAYPAGEASIVDHLRYWAAERPDAVAISFYGRDVTYAEYDELSDRFAGWLAAQGIGAGDRVGVHLANCPQFPIAMLGILKAGAVHVPVNPLFKAFELEHELVDAQVQVLLTSPDQLELVESVRPRTPLRRVAATALDDLRSGPGAGSDWAEIIEAPRAEPVPSDPDVLAALNYTGGTTGMPKGCEHTQRHMAYTAATATLAGGADLGEPDCVSMNFLPVFWIAGEDFGILKPLVNGQRVVLLTRWDAAVVVDQIAEYGVTDLVATVDSYLEILDLPDLKPSALGSLTSTLAVSFVTRLDPGIRARWREVVGSTLREASYGMTETHTADTFTLGFQDSDRDLLTDPVFCGLPVPGTDVLIVDADGMPVPIGDTGEIILRSPSILTRYLDNLQATDDAIRDGWLHTGDVGRLDEWGALHYLARTKEMIKINGMSVFPSEVEALMRRHDGIEAISVVPRPDPDRGQVPVAFVVASDDGLDAAALTAWARENLATYKVPEVILVDALPMTATGKIRKGDLLARAAETTPGGAR